MKKYKVIDSKAYLNFALIVSHLLQSHVFCRSSYKHIGKSSQDQSLLIIHIVEFSEK